MHLSKLTSERIAAIRVLVADATGLGGASLLVLATFCGNTILCAWRGKYLFQVRFP